MGCEEFARKPELEYKLGNPNNKNQPVRLQGPEDWQGCVEDAVSSIKKKKQPESVYILVSDVVRFFNLFMGLLLTIAVSQLASNSTQKEFEGRRASTFLQ
jgi:hypothetical protein